MELRAFAEQVLLGTTLEEKLRQPAGITDEHPGAPLVVPTAPGRPAALRFKPQGSGKADFPGVHRLENERERGRLLHFFANHELLAAELMALALLRFPDAPAAFRRGLLQTLKDEQLHTRLYVQRMSQCGIAFGELPVSGYFWRAVSTMEHPLDYVTGLCLTFEQANLDFCRYFAGGFEAAGDRDTAQLLERIYRDEIGHVAYGLKWFRRWKDPRQSDWDAFCRQLKFPLSPSRAKGITLNVEGRSAAGFDGRFIAELNVHSQSKGRTPGLFLFNPFTEGYLARGRAFSPTQHQRRLAGDLENLPQFLCRQDDIVLVSKRQSVEFLSGIKQAGFPLPEFVEFDLPWTEGARRPTLTNSAGSAPAICGQNLATRKLGRLRPWAWGPDSLELLAPFFTQVTGEERTTDTSFNPAIATLYSKAWSAAFLRKFLASVEAEPWLCAEHEVGVAVNSLEHALEAIAAIRGRGHHRVVAKEALGLAGHNAIRLWEPQLLETQRRWMAKVLHNGRQLVIEPWLERVEDFSVQMEMGTGGLGLCGYTGLINDRKGQFQANWAAANYHRRIPARILAHFSAPADIARRIQDLYGRIFLALEAELRRAGYLGPVSIDSFVYRTPEGASRLKPIVEINPRYTMGRIAVELMQHTCPGSHGLFRLVSQATVRAEGFADFNAYARSLRERVPLLLEGKPVPKIRQGALCLNDPASAQLCLAVFQVSRTLDSEI